MSSPGQRIAGRSPPAGLKGLARAGLDGAPVTAWLLLANIAVYVGQLAYTPDLHMVSGLGAADPIVADRIARALLAFGSNYAPFVIREWRVETLVTSCFVHFSVQHIVFNMAMLGALGAVVERTVGAARFASMYLTSGIVGAATSAAWGWFFSDPDRTSAGASGALCGILGAALILGLRLQGWRGPAVRAMAFWLVVTIGLGAWLKSDNAAHIGGALTGLLFALAWRDGVTHSRARARMLVGIPVAVVLASGLAVAGRDAIDPWATLNIDGRIAYAEAALNRASCRDAALATERAARIVPSDASEPSRNQRERVRELKRIILIGCRPSS